MKIRKIEHLGKKQVLKLMPELKLFYYKKELNRSKIKKEADIAFSNYIRLRDGGSVLSGSFIVKNGVKIAENCGHLFKRSDTMTRYDEDCAFGLTEAENNTDEMLVNPRLLAWFLKNPYYGIAVYNKKKRMANTICKLPAYELLEIREQYLIKYNKLLTNIL